MPSWPNWAPGPPDPKVNMVQYATAEEIKASGRLTPMMRQYLEIKESHPDAILFFRLGDFYEMFFDDALTASELLELTLTSRDKNEEPVPMCGIPHHSAKNYITRLVEAGHKVAICDQVEDPATAKKLVRREVVRVVTPGLVGDPDLVEARMPHYLLCVAPGQDGGAGFAYVDATTGEFRVGEATGPDHLAEEIGRIAPHEIVVGLAPEQKPPEKFPWVPSGVRVELTGNAPPPEIAAKKIAAHWGLPDLAGLELSGLGPGLSACVVALEYIRKNLSSALPNLMLPGRHVGSGVMFLGETTLRNLEIFQTMTGDRKKSTLIALMDRTRTSMGGRELRRRMLYPLLDPEKINARLDAVAELAARGETRRKLREALREVGDIERLTGKMVMRAANGRDLAALGRALMGLPHIKTLVADADSALLKQSSESIDPLGDLCEAIRSAIVDTPPPLVNEGGIIRDGHNPDVDELRAIQRGGRSWIASLAAAEKEKTGIPSLKIGFNKVFGYYIEVGRARAGQVPAYFERRQTLANAERYVTPELKEMEAKILGAEERLHALEYRLFMEVVAEAAKRADALRRTSAALASLDTEAALAELAVERRYVRPRVETGYDLKIVGGRHPVVEAMLTGERFVPNDVAFDREKNRLLIITGPNMSGKSTILRQTAVIALMAQMGSFVPAQSAVMGVVDRIFTRVGASDDIASGRSTFMVEMVETAAILSSATARSLVILDEIGRGTSTFDGLSIAWAVAEYIHELGARTLFATHYHELTDLARTLGAVANFNVAVKQWEGRIIFLRRLVEGAVNRSYGIEVAKLAGLPVKVTSRAQKVLENLQSGELDDSGLPRFAAGSPLGRSPSRRQPELFIRGEDPEKKMLFEELSQLQVESTTPVEALVMLLELRDRALKIKRGQD